ncbi:response regulator [Marimonas sp. MJW-29]|uniref:Response regulator n=1 Tax=Sulfitobacter sediminis TaxID=3234186 RepID=A0ABV3RKT9_9RHOB
MLNTSPNKAMLIVDTDEAFRDCLASDMRKRGFDVRTCATVQESMATIEANSPRYAIIDIRLGEDNGLVVLKALNQSSSEVRSVILTSHGDARTAVAAIKLGACDYLLKPSSAEEIIGALVGSADAYLDAPEPPVSVVKSQSGYFEESLDAVA